MKSLWEDGMAQRGYGFRAAFRLAIADPADLSAWFRKYRPNAKCFIFKL